MPRSATRANALDHVVVVLFENRSLDNVLGRLYSAGDGNHRARQADGNQAPSTTRRPLRRTHTAARAAAGPAGRRSASGPASRRRSRWTWRAGAGTCAGPRPSPRTPGTRRGRGRRRTPRSASTPARSARIPPPAACPPARPLARRARLVPATRPWARMTPGTPPARQPPAPALSAARRSPGQSRPAAGARAGHPPAVPSAPLRASSDSSAPAAQQAATNGHGPRVQEPGNGSHSCAATGPGPIRAGPLPSCGSSVARPAVAIKSARPSKNTGLRTYASPPTGPAGDAHATLEPCADQAPEFLT